MSERAGLFVTAGLALAALLVALYAAQPGPRYGYADASELLQTYPRAAEVREQIDRELAPVQAKLAEQRTATERIAKRLETERESLAAEERAVLQQQVVLAMQRQSELEAKFDQVAKKLETDRMQPIWDELDAGLRAYGEANGYAMIWSATSAGNLAYASDAANVTDDLIAWMATHPPSTE